MLAGHSVTSNSVSRECHRNISGRCELLFNPVFSRFKMLHSVAFPGCRTFGSLTQGGASSASGLRFALG